MISKALKPLRAAALVALAAALAPVAGLAASEGEHVSIPRQKWTFGGIFGQFDDAQLQRGFQVYQEVCSACHGLNGVAFRNLVEPGGPQFPEEAVKELARNWPNKVLDGPNDEGKMFEREPRLSDPVLGPYRNEKEARAAQNGALPPDLSLIAKARSVEPTSPWYIHPFLMLRDVAVAYQEGGVDYTYALLDGYKETPPGFTLAEGMSYNTAFPGHQIAMAPPLSKDRIVTYQDGSGSPEQNMKDVTAFLAWAGDPSLEARKHMGWQVILYLLITTVLLYLAKKRLWSKLH
jgi:ubiquinol-cytochrome c reductase cytochrome c1 subunit